MGFKEKEVLVNNFVCSNFNYCHLVLHFCSAKSLYEIKKNKKTKKKKKNEKKIQERALRLLRLDFASDYTELLKNQVKSQ